MCDTEGLLLSQNPYLRLEKYKLKLRFIMPHSEQEDMIAYLITQIEKTKTLIKEKAV